MTEIAVVSELYRVSAFNLVPVVFYFSIAATDREKDAGDPSTTGPGADTAQPPKRPRIQLHRNRYQSSSGNGNNFAMVKKLLQTDPQAADKNRSGRKD